MTCLLSNRQTAIGKLEQTSYAFSQTVYSAAQPQAASASSFNGPDSASSDVDDTIDVKFEVES